VTDTPAANSETPAEAAEPAKEKSTKPFELIAGAKVEYATRTGTVVDVRGNGDAPYDVQIRWKGEKYPVWFLYRALEVAYGQGEFRIVKQGTPSFLSKICPFC